MAPLGNVLAQPKSAGQLRHVGTVRRVQERSPTAGGDLLCAVGMGVAAVVMQVSREMHERNGSGAREHAFQIVEVVLVDVRVEIRYVSESTQCGSALQMMMRSPGRIDRRHALK